MTAALSPQGAGQDRHGEYLLPQPFGAWVLVVQRGKGRTYMAHFASPKALGLKLSRVFRQSQKKRSRKFSARVRVALLCPFATRARSLSIPKLSLTRCSRHPRPSPR
jgi:hypothetical protein